MKKKQIVFIEPKPIVYTYRIARSLKLTQRYETILVSFSKVDKKFFNKAYDKILILELSHKIDSELLKTLTNFFKTIFGKKARNLFKTLKKMNPHMFQITGPDLFSLMTISFLKENPCPKIYYSNDTWGADKKNFFLTKKFWAKGEFQKIFEKICFKKADGVINKTSLEELKMLDYKIDVPKMSPTQNCLDEWIFPPKKKKNKEIHLVFGGSPAHPSFTGEVSQIKIIKIITSQKIHFHTYGSCFNKKENQIFIKESKKNKYYHFHKKINPNNLNKEMSKYDYGVFFFFMDPIKKNLFPEEQKRFRGTKMMNYLESGLPIISNRQYEAITETINKYGIGFGIDVGDLTNLRKILEKKDYHKFQKNIKKFQEKFRWSKGIKEIEEFYDKIIKMHKKRVSKNN